MGTNQSDPLPTLRNAIAVAEAKAGPQPIGTVTMRYDHAVYLLVEVERLRAMQKTSTGEN